MPNCNYCSQTLNPRHARLLRVTFEPMQRNWRESLVQSNCITDRENLIGVGGVRISPRRIQKHRQTGPTVLAALCFKRLWERPMTSTVRKRAVALAPKVPCHDFFVHRELWSCRRERKRPDGRKAFCQKWANCATVNVVEQ